MVMALRERASKKPIMPLFDKFGVTNDDQPCRLATDNIIFVPSCQGGETELLVYAKPQTIYSQHVASTYVESLVTTA